MGNKTVAAGVDMPDPAGGSSVGVGSELVVEIAVGWRGSGVIETGVSVAETGVVSGVDVITGCVDRGIEIHEHAIVMDTPKTTRYKTDLRILFPRL